MEGLTMMLIDMTKELSPILFGLNVALLVAAAALLGQVAVNRWFRSLGRFEWRRPVLHKPVLVR
jgi:hypothetical protein